MIEEDEQNIIVLRKRRRDAANGNDHANGNRNGHGHTNGHAPNRDGDWGWTRGKNPFTEPREQSSRRQQRQERESRPRISYQMPKPDPNAPPDTIKLPFDPWRLLGALQRRWHWLLLGPLIFGGLAFFAGDKLVRYKVSVNLIRREVSNAINPNEQDPNRPRALADQTLFAFMRSGEVLRRVAARAATNTPPFQVTAQELSKSVSVTPTAIPDILTLTVAGTKDSVRLAALANIYAEEVVRYTREIQASESGDVASYLQQKVALVDKDLNAASQELAQFQKSAGFVNLEKDSERYMTQIANYEVQYETARIDLEMVDRLILGTEAAMKRETPKEDKVKLAQEKLDGLLVNYQPAHPLVAQAQKELEYFKKLAAQNGIGTNATTGIVNTGSSFQNTLYLQKVEYEARKAGLEKKIAELRDLMNGAKGKIEGLSDKSQQYGNLKARVQSLEATRLLLANRQRDSQLFTDNAMGYYRVHGQASAKDVNWKNRLTKISAMTVGGAAMGLVFAALLAVLSEISDTRLKTVADIERATQLPVLATLGELRKMSPTEQDDWAFRTLTHLRGKLCATSDEALICGFISAKHGEGRSTWVNRLDEAAKKRGLRVLKLDMRSDGEGPWPEPPPGATTKDEKTNGAESEDPLRDIPKVKPMDMVKRLGDADSIVQFPVPGWVWSLDGRKQWQDALSQWRDTENTVILIDLPPASSPEAILLAEKIPNLIWLTGSGMADVKETRGHLETLRHAHCNVVGAALNREPAAPLNTRIGRWFNWTASMIALGLGLCGTLHAQEQTPAPDQKLAFSGAAQIKRAAWQERLTLGPGDTMDISLYGHPDLTRTNLFVGPDGRLSYLQAQAINVTGLTIEELRARLDEELAKYYTTARTIVIPTGFNSKKYYVLGKVQNKGVFALDRPMTVIEAVARAQGLETGLYERNTVEMADLSRSFLIRNGQRQKLDFEKLFFEGDLSQNVAIEPDDFLFFGAASVSENYVLGEVMNPGPVGYVQSTTVLTAITDRGGFSSRAYKGKVLVVRGSLNKPTTYVVNTKDILAGAEPDFKLESKDIVFVAQRPWIRAEELLDEATQSFIQGFVTAFSGVKIGPLIKNPIFGN